MPSTGFSEPAFLGRHGKPTFPPNILTCKCTGFKSRVAAAPPRFLQRPVQTALTRRALSRAKGKPKTLRSSIQRGQLNLGEGFRTGGLTPFLSPLSSPSSFGG